MGRIWHETGICSSFSRGLLEACGHGEVTWQTKR